MLAFGIGPISEIEAVWIIVAMFGAFYAFKNKQAAKQNRQALEERGIKNGRWKLARFFWSSASTRLVIQLIFLTIGILAAITPATPVPPAPLIAQILRKTASWSLVLCSVLLASVEFRESRTRDEILMEGVEKR